MADRKLFAIPMAPSTPGKASNVASYFVDPVLGPNLTGKVTKVGKAAQAAYNNLPPEVKTIVNTQTTKTVNQVKDYVGNKVSNKISEMTGSPDSPITSGEGNSNSHSSGYALSSAPLPFPVTLDSGIRPNTYVSDYLDAKENICSPLHMTSAKIQIPSYIPLKDYFDKIIAFDIQSKAQSNVSFNINITSVLSTANIYSAMTALIDALQIYYYYKSIITYHSDPRNKNEGMIYLRTLITSTDIENLSLLNRALSDIPTPPRLMELIRYLSANFMSGMNPGSPLLKLCPVNVVDTNLDGTKISDALIALRAGSNNEVFSLLRRCVPAWVPGVLQDIPLTPVYDSNFVTIFANLPATYYNGSAATGIPTVTTDSEEIIYNSFANNLDGISYALTGMFKTSTWYPGLIVPIVATGGANIVNTSSRRSYYDVGGTKKLYATTPYSFLKRSRLESYTPNEASTSLISAHLPGADLCKGVNINSIRETTYSVMDYLMSLDVMNKARPNQRRRSK